MISLTKNFTKEYDDTVEFMYQDITSSSIFPITDRTPINFEINGIPNVLIDPQEIYISLEVAILKLKDDGTFGKIPDGEPVAFEQAPLYSLFKDVLVSFNHIEVENSHGNYAYKSYTSLMLSTNVLARESFLTTALYREDTAGALDLVNPAVAAINDGSFKRNRASNKGVTVYLRGKVLADTLQIDKPILDNVSISLSFIPAEPKACLISSKNEQYAVEIQNCYLTVGRITPLSRRIPSRNYNFLRNVVKKVPHGKEQNFIIPTTITRGILPKLVTIVIVSEDSLSSYSKARFNFGAHFLENLTLSLNGKELPYTNGYNMDYEKKAYTQPYMGMFHKLQKSDFIPNSNLTLPQFPYDSYDSGYAFYVFNCEKGHGNSEVDGTNIGNLEISGRFAKKPANNLILIVMLSFEHSFTIDSNRNVIFAENKFKNGKNRKIKRKMIV